ncbi:MAG: hypothetical protein DPW09_23455 [Anaerolineae bacterium]|nr:hypothetical protein [Anaerolineales bacterium]MCQ3976398.1 hypothetical protein [Anaerolineae bacterium]
MDRLDRWELEPLQDLVETLPFSHTFKVTFTRARKNRRATIPLGWLALYPTPTNVYGPFISDKLYPFAETTLSKNSPTGI